MKLMDKLSKYFDGYAEKSVRQSARAVGRRHFLSKMGAVIVGTGALPLLPFDRSMGKAYAQGTAVDDTSCDYWRYCAIDGNLCSTAGGSVNTCPAGTEPSKVSWVGTCLNPKDNKNYMLSYSDCCGKAPASNAEFCYTSKGERPGYKMGLHNDINWCMANANKGYSCTVSTIVGVANV